MKRLLLSLSVLVFSILTITALETKVLSAMDVAEGTSFPFVTRGSAGHKSLTFLNRLEGDTKTTLYEIQLSGGEASPLFAFETSIRSYEWSLDRQHAAAVSSPSPILDNPLNKNLLWL